MDTDDPFSADVKEPHALKTFYLRASTLNKIRELQARAPNPRKILASLKKAIDAEVDRLLERAPKK